MLKLFALRVKPPDFLGLALYWPTSLRSCSREHIKRRLAHIAPAGLHCCGAICRGDVDVIPAPPPLPPLYITLKGHRRHTRLYTVIQAGVLQRLDTASSQSQNQLRWKPHGPRFDCVISFHTHAWRTRFSSLQSSKSQNQEVEMKTTRPPPLCFRDFSEIISGAQGWAPKHRPNRKENPEIGESHKVPPVDSVIPIQSHAWRTIFSSQKWNKSQISKCGWKPQGPPWFRDFLPKQSLAHDV